MDLARRADRKKVRDITVSLQLQTENLTRNDLRSWRYAWQQAINVEQPRRNRLYNIYTDVDVDGHLAGCVEQRTGFVMNKGFRIVDRSGAENEDLRELFETPWFKQWMRLSLESIYYDTRPNHQNNELSVRRSASGCGMVLEYLSIVWNRE